jgi:4-hydroxy-tetrahydrodipicolinate reductase
MNILKIAIIGAGGRMGRRLAALAMESEQFDIVSAVERKGHETLGRDMGELAGVGAFGLKVTETFQDRPDVAIDFSSPESTLRWVDECQSQAVAMVIGTTGLTPSQEAHVADVASKIPIVKAGNYSLGINLLCRLVAQAAKALGEEYDIEVSETHHRFKADAPSGTAIMLARAACEALGRDYGEVATLGRGGRQPRKPGEIGMHALRLGDTVGEHSVHFGSLGETITLSHSAHTRDTFVHGALRAARWVAGKPAGLYSMQDVLGL